jgi:hypothetical protein
MLVFRCSMSVFSNQTLKHEHQSSFFNRTSNIEKQSSIFSNRTSKNEKQSSNIKPQKMLKSYTSSFLQNWKESLLTSGYTPKLLTAVTVFVSGVLQFPTYFRNIQKRPGTDLNDFVLDYIPFIDVSTYIFAIIYGFWLNPNCFCCSL